MVYLIFWQRRAGCAKLRGLRLVIVHNHFRPGGVRRVIELAAPELSRTPHSGIEQVVLVGGEMPESPWLKRFESLVEPVRVNCMIDPSLAYVSEQKERANVVNLKLRRFLARVLGDESDCVVWAHNQGVGRNLLLTRELQRACGLRGIPLVMHHHDWWFDNRWQRWAEMRESGFQTLRDVAEVVFSSASNVRHAAINQADANTLRRYLGNRAEWLPNPADEPQPIPACRLVEVRRWLERVVGTQGPVWLLPCRLLRRKNIAEAILLTRWLRPEAWLVTTGGASSAGEEPYAAALSRATKHQGWQVRLGVLAGLKTAHPEVTELLAASEAVLLTSLQEGFGLPYLEAAAARRPLVARALPNIMPDLTQLGFRFPQSYDEVLIPRDLFDCRAERKRQERLFARWRSQLPRRWASMAKPPILLLNRTAPVPFSRLTLEAQLELLSIPTEQSWQGCVPYNAFLPEWRDLAARQALRNSNWPRSARQLSPRAYASRWRELLKRKPSAALDKRASLAAQSRFMREKLATSNLYPLNWA